MPDNAHAPRNAMQPSPARPGRRPARVPAQLGRGLPARVVWLALLSLLMALPLLLTPASAFAGGQADGARGEAAGAPPALVVYVRSGCPHCTAAKAHLAELARTRPQLPIVLRAVDEAPDARAELAAITRAAGQWPPGVPTFVYEGKVMVGFADGGDGAAALAALLAGGPAPADRAAVHSRLFGVVDAERLGLPLFTLIIGLLDGVNPCAMWVLLFLLALLVRLQDRRRLVLVAGTFLLASGLMYYAFLAAWFNLFQAVGASRGVNLALGWLALGVGMLNVKDFLAWGRGFSLAIPARAKPGLYARMRQVVQARALGAALVAAASLAVVVNFVELLCTAGLPAVYTAVLARQALPPLMHHAYLALYIAAYLADDLLMVAGAVLALSSGKLGEQGGRRLKLVSGILMLTLGLVLLLRPQWLG